jgi:hypothetical protein
MQVRLIGWLYNIKGRGVGKVDSYRKFEDFETHFP